MLGDEYSGGKHVGLAKPEPPRYDRDEEVGKMEPHSGIMDQKGGICVDSVGLDPPLK